MDKHNFKFSIIIPVYNVELYLEETINSVINQTMDFTANTQIILVNDGSTDNSEEVCLKFKNLYPDNIIYVKKENTGVSSSRNLGLKYSNAEYVNFLDSDDIWEKHTLENVYSFFELYKNEIDVVACRIKMFGKQNSFHPLDFKFKANRIVDITKDFSFIQLNGPTVFVKQDIAKEFKFEENLKFGEDPFWVNQIILNKGKYGILKDGLYLYRKREESVSAQDTNNMCKDYYIDNVNYYLKGIYEYTKKTNKLALKYIETLLLYEIYWKIKLKIPKGVLDSVSEKQYISELYKIIIKISDDVILKSPFLNIAYKVYFLGKKHHNLSKLLKISNKKGIQIGNTSFNDSNLFKNVIFNKFRVSDSKLIIHGKLTPIFSESLPRLFLKSTTDNQQIEAQLFEVKNWNIYSCFGEIITKTYIFRFEIDLKEVRNAYEIFASYGNNKIQLKYKVQNYKLSFLYASYLNIDNKCLISGDGSLIKLRKKNPLLAMYYEIRCICSLLAKLKIKTLFKRILVPVYYFLENLKPLKRIIILESNPDYSDNAKVLFDVLIKNKVNEKYLIVWFVNDPDEFKNIKIKNVKFLKFFGIPKKKLDNFTKYCYRNAKIILDGNKYIHKYKKKQIRIHLNHGSPFKNAIHYNLNIGEVDYDVVQSEFFADVESTIRDIDRKKIVSLGFPRNDYLYSKTIKKFKKIDDLKANKIILWLPTYRNHNSSNILKSDLPYGLSCIQNEKELKELNSLLNKNNTYILIKFHPAENIDLLKQCDLSNIIVTTNEELEQNNLILYDLFKKVDALITDYSSVYFDFCLTKKNIGLAISDFDEYVKENGDFQYPYNDVIVGNYMFNNKDLLEFVNDVSKGIDKTYDKRIELIKKFDDYCDGKSAERIYDFISKKL